MTRVTQDRYVLLATLLLALALRLMGFTDPWSWGADGENPGIRNFMGACSIGQIVRNFHNEGVGPSSGLPHYFQLELADGTRIDEWYTHHPATWTNLCALSLKAFGPSEWALRLPALLCSLLGVVLLWRLADDLLGRAQARFAALAMAVFPLGGHFGIQPWAESAVVCAVIAVAHRYLRWVRTDDMRHLLFAGLWTLVGGLIDWPAFLVLPGIALHGLTQWRHRSFLCLKPALVLACAAVLAIIVHSIHLLAVLPEAAMAEDVQKTSGYLFSVPSGVWGFIEIQGSHVWTLLTPLGCALVLVGMAVQVSRTARRRGVESSAILGALFLCGLLNIALFPGRSIDHSFFHLLAAPWYACSAAIGASALVRVFPGAARRVAMAILVLSLIGLGTLRTYDLWQTHSGTELQETLAEPWLAAVLSDRQAIVLTDSWRVLMFGYYASGRFLMVTDPEMLLDLRRKGLQSAPGHRVYFISDPVGRRQWRKVWPFIEPLPKTTHGEFTVTRLSRG